MTHEEEKKIVEDWLEDRPWVRCTLCETPITVGQRPFTVFVRDERPRFKIEVECFPCQDRDENETPGKEEEEEDDADV